MAARNDRNNNPGNLRPGVGNIIWDNQTGTDDDGFATFKTRAAGIRAADLNLQTYAKRGLKTVFDVVRRWSATDQEAYTNYVTTKLGVRPTEPIDLENPQVRKNLLTHIFKFEGSQYK